MSRLLFYGLTLVVIWGTAFTMLSVAVRHISPIWLVALRLMMGASLVVAYTYVKGYRLPGLTDVRWRWYAMLGFMGMALPFFLTATGQQTIDSGISSILTATMPLLTIILAHFFTDEKLTARKMMGFLLGFCGIIVLFMPDDFNMGLIQDWQAQLLVIAAAFCYAVTTVAAKRAPETPAAVGAAMMVSCAAFMTLLMAVFTEPMPSDVPMIGWLTLLGLAVGSTAVGTILYLHVIDVAGPSFMASINYFVPVMSVFCGVWLLSEPFTTRIFIAFAMTLAGVILAGSGRKKAQT